MHFIIAFFPYTLKKNTQNVGNYSLLDEEWLRPISAKDLIIGSRDTLSFFLSRSRSPSCWCRCRRSRVSRTFSLQSAGKVPALTILSHTKSAICSKLVASMSSITDPFSSKDRNSNRECRERVATCGFDHRLPFSSTSSSNFTHRAVSFHSRSSPSPTSSSISEKSGCDSWVPSSTSSPRINCTRWAGGVTANKRCYISIRVNKCIL